MPITITDATTTTTTTTAAAAVKLPRVPTCTTAKTTPSTITSTANYYSDYCQTTITSVLLVSFALPVVIKPPGVEKNVVEAAAAATPQPKTSSSDPEVKHTSCIGSKEMLCFFIHLLLFCQCAVEESPDVILIKDEDDIGGCEPVEGEEYFRAVGADGFLLNHNHHLI